MQDKEELERLRRAELETIRVWFKPGDKVLEIGGGSGFQGAILSSWGCHVTSVDLYGVAERATHYPVVPFDGVHLDFENQSFDRIFSSNVLEHVVHLDQLQEEIHRVLKPTGLAIHILPSPFWRFWTTLAHYVHAFLRVIGLRHVAKGCALSVPEKLRHQGLWSVIKSGLVVRPHGEYPSALSELYFFSRWKWRKVFRNAHFVIGHTAGSGLFYTGYDLLPMLSLELRKRLAGVMGSVTYIYVLRAN